MLSMILIRDDKIAFSKFPGEYGDTSNMTHSCKDMMTSSGMFMPLSDHGMQALPMLRSPDAHLKNFHEDPEDYHLVQGVKGILATPGWHEPIDYSVVRIGKNNKIALQPLALGKGFGAFSSYDYLRENMAMCVRLTDTIEDTIAMYCRHHVGNINHVVITTHEQLKKDIATHYLEYRTFEKWAIKRTILPTIDKA